MDNSEKSSPTVGQLGPLERQLMEFVWRSGEVSVREVHHSFHAKLAYTTLMTTLDRLHKKGLLARRKDGRAFFYSPRLSPEEFERGIVRHVIETLLGRNADGVEPLLACIVDAVTEYDRNLLDELDQLIEEKRHELRRKG